MKMRVDVAEATAFNGLSVTRKIRAKLKKDVENAHERLMAAARESTDPAVARAVSALMVLERVLDEVNGKEWQVDGSDDSE